MNSEWQAIGQNGGRAPATALPPEAIEEACWDVLLALHSDSRCELSFAKLASLASVTEPALRRRLAALEERRLVSGVQHQFTGEVRALLTPTGRAVLDRYLPAACELQVGIGH